VRQQNQQLALIVTNEQKSKTHHKLTNKTKALADIRRSPARDFVCSDGAAGLQT
jgi:hypothetical protein